jgi:hypothetical protein
MAKKEVAAVIETKEQEAPAMPEETLVDQEQEQEQEEGDFQGTTGENPEDTVSEDEEVSDDWEVSEGIPVDRDAEGDGTGITHELVLTAEVGMEAQIEAMEGEVLPAITEEDVLRSERMSLEDYNKAVRAIRLAPTAMRNTLLQIYEGQGYFYDGYANWEEFCKTEMGYSGNRGYMVLQAARVERHILTVDKKLALPTARISSAVSTYVYEQLARLDNQDMQDRAYAELVEVARKNAEEDTGSKSNYVRYLKGDDTRKIVERLLREALAPAGSITPIEQEREALTAGPSAEASEATGLLSAPQTAETGEVAQVTAGAVLEAPTAPQGQEGLSEEEQEKAFEEEEKFEGFVVLVDTLAAWVDGREITDKQEEILWALSELENLTAWVKGYVK